MVKVEAKFTSNIDTLSVDRGCPNYDYPEGWSTFISPISKGVYYIGDSKWLANNRRKVEYEVDLSFVNKKWDVGNEQAGIFIDESMYVVTRALFLTTDKDQKISVSFEIPKGYFVTTPWTTQDENQFIVHSIEELRNNSIVWGKAKPHAIITENFDLRIVLLGYDSKVNDLVKGAFQNVSQQYMAIFPGTPKSTYLITAFPAEQNDGEAYTTSHAFTLKAPIGEHTKPVWASLFAHELFHFWNGGIIDCSEDWFSEGFTEYFANLALIQSGIISKNNFYRMIEKTIGLYYYFKEQETANTAIADADEYRFATYNGGWCIAFGMDMMIREKFPDRSLADYMNILFKKYGLHGKPIGLTDLKKEFADFKGSDNDFFENYITGTKKLPVQRWMSEMGLILDYTSYEATAFIVEDPYQNKEQEHIRKKWLGGSDTLSNKK